MAVEAGPPASSSAPELAPVPCTKCRKRRVKCDKRLPGCARCEKGSEPCPGYNRVRSFVDQRSVLRQRYGPESVVTPISTQKDVASSRADTVSDTGAPATPPDPVPIVPAKPTSELPGTGVSKDVPILSKKADTSMGEPISGDTLGSNDLPGATDWLADPTFETDFFDIDPVAYYADEMNCCGWIPNATSINDVDGFQGPSLSWLGQISTGNFSDSTRSPSANTPTETDATSLAQSKASQQEEERETAHLIQHYSANISPCLDVFDIEKYFGHVVPIRAHNSTLLTNLVAAIAAKQYAKTRKPITAADSTSKTSILDIYSDNLAAESDWFYKAASFYDKAICQMMALLHNIQNGNTEMPSTTQLTDKMVSPRRSDNGNGAPQTKRRRVERVNGRGNIMDDLLAAVSIFLLYESLDDRQLEMLGHMSGAQFLLSKNLPAVSNQFRGAMPLGPMGSPDTVKAWRASFWNVVRVDYVLSYVKGTVPLVDTTNSELWEAAGLPLRQSNGVLMPGALCGSDADGSLDVMNESTACRSLLWITLKILNFVATERNRIALGGPQAESVSQGQSAQDAWKALREHLEDWEAAIPGSFEPFATLNDSEATNARPSAYNDTSVGEKDDVVIQFPTLMYTTYMASTVMVLYHFMQVFLLLNKPLDPIPSESFARFASKRLEAYRKLSQEIDEHVRNICGICLGQPNEPTRMHTAQALHLAGLSLESNEQRVTLEGLVSGIQSSSGCSMEWVMTSLHEEWGWRSVSPAEVVQ